MLYDNIVVITTRFGCGRYGESINKRTPPRVDFGARSVFVHVLIKLRLAGGRIVWIGDTGQRRDGFFFGGVPTACAAGSVRAEVAVIAEVVHFHPSQGDRNGDGKDRTGRQGAGEHAGIHRRDAAVDRLAVNGDAQGFTGEIWVAYCQREVDKALCRITSADGAFQQRLERGRGGGFLLWFQRTRKDQDLDRLNPGFRKACVLLLITTFIRRV